MPVYIDQDGVLADFVGGAARVVGIPRDKLLEKWPVGKYDGLYCAIAPIKRDDFWARVAMAASFWPGLEPLQPGLQLALDIHHGGHPVTVVTAPPVEDDRSSSGKAAWIRTYMPTGTQYCFMPAELKHKLARHRSDILVDDRDDNIARWIDAGGTGFVWPQHWNSARDIPYKDVAQQVLAAVNCLANPQATPAPPAQPRGKKDLGMRYDLIPTYPLARLAECFTVGAQKYAARNWELGIPWSKNYAAMIRHVMAWWSGEEKDTANGQLHLASVAWHAFALMQYAVTHPELDDRPKSAGDALTASIIKSYARHSEEVDK